MASARPLLAVLPLLLLSALAPPAAAAPTVLLSDAAGDASVWVPVIDEDPLDLLTVSVDSDGADLTVTFEVADLYDGQPDAHYDLQFDLATSTGTVFRVVMCDVGDHGTDLGELAPWLVVSLECSLYIPDLPLGLSPSVVVASTADFAADTVTATIPYSLLGASPGDVVGDPRAESCEDYFLTGICPADDTLPSTATYTLS